ncbi:hypothetical protein D3C81_1872830 [compost metagenome]
MRIDLILQHPVFQVLLLLLIGQPVVHQRYDILGQPVDAAPHIAKLAVPLNVAVDQEIALRDFVDPFLEFFHRQTDGPG